MKMRLGQLLLVAVLGGAVTLAGYYWIFGTGETTTVIREVPAARVLYSPDENGDMVPVDFTRAAEKVMPAVVGIRSTSERTSTPDRSLDPFRDFFGSPFFDNRGPSVSSGSGVIITESGYVVTNNHVVRDADVVEVTLNDNREFKAEVIGTDPDTDLALLKIKTSGLPFLSFVDSDQSKVGEWVMAVGNPFGLTSTVTAGIISAKGRNIQLLNTNQDGNTANTAIESFIQTDAAINPGNSGGALVNLKGDLLGINTAIASNTGSYAGYGFAVPSNIVSKVVEDLMKFGAVQRGWLGVEVRSVDSQLMKENDLEVSEGAYIASVADKGAAKEGGLQAGDVVVKIDNAQIKSSSGLIESIGRHRPGDKVNITVNRKGREVTLPVTLKSRDGSTTLVRPDEKSAAGMGVELEELDSKTLKRLELDHGVRVKSLGNGKIRRYTDMRDGFIITHVDDQPVTSAREFNALMAKKKAGDLVTITGTYEDFPREFIYAFRY
jgi:Do/DeqQ family serine protease